MAIECYAQRLLDPYRGAMLTIRHEAAEAVTLDGVRWDIYVANDQLRDGVKALREIQVSDVRYGSWTREQGLKRGPLYPSDDFRRLEAMGATVYEHLVAVHDRIPFPFADRFELWLLDRERLPLALLQSVVRPQEMDLRFAPQWRPGIAARERFTSPSAEALVPGLAEATSAADCLARYVGSLAGEQPCAQWFRRDPDGSGSALQGIGSSSLPEGSVLSRDTFPSLMISERDHDEAHRRLIQDFFAWQAPWLLTLAHLDTATRRRLEQQARSQALLVEAQHRLYPATADRAVINAILVEATLRRALPPAARRQDAAMSTFYIELEPDAGD
jgi:hypothetical protein